MTLVAFGTLSPMISDVLGTVFVSGRGLRACCYGPVGWTGGAAYCAESTVSGPLPQLEESCLIASLDLN
ncbi:hypothetical protein J6590_087710 [Homalodisca vitripennis]|nr:hypothetical protein J6590_091895 [Homalodisca vitripennis]KAG8275358.1 hypothetical protein J6590_087710 [Homalodisca vitripennis]